MKTATKTHVPEPDALPTGRLAFVPTLKGRQYFWGLCQRAAADRAKEKGLKLRVPQWEVFDLMVEYAEAGEAVLRAAAQKKASKVA